MIAYLQENYILILAIAGAFITLLIAINEKVARKKNVRLTVILFFLSFMLVTGKLIIEDFLEDQFKDREEKIKNEIRSTVKETLSVTLSIKEQLSRALKGASPDKIGVELIKTNVSDEYLTEYDKGPPSEWNKFAEWLEDFSRQENAQEKQIPCLSITLNADNKYRVSLLLAYLFTNSKTQEEIKAVISRGWGSFPDSRFIDRYDIPNPDLKFVLFYDGSTKKLVGYANARLFAEELLRYKKIGEQTKILVENIMKNKKLDYMSDMMFYFKSFNNYVAEGKDAFTLATEMLENKINEMVVVYKDKTFLVNLSNIVKIVQ